MPSGVITIRNESGFHIRPAQLFTEKAATYQSTILLQPEGHSAQIDGKSILGLMTLGLTKGTVLRITTEGPDEAEALDTLIKLVESGFGEI
ncbi:MAG: hypothetical protein K0R57_1052 [Paenibacillaceae bacterium]|jgi:phosphocarrier protein HPr/phosphocarrier protein|nr:hypothetical protein [Paenibacillaceae bacterium]